MEASLVASEVDKDKLTGRARSLANLRPIPKGMTLNPTGRAGRGPNRREVFAKLLEAPDDDEPTLSRFQALVMSMLKAAKSGDSIAGKTLVSEYLPKQTATPSTLDYAEHLRQVEADKARLVSSIIGDRLKTMDGKAVGEFLRECSVNADTFIQAAKRLEEDTDQPESLSPIEATSTTADELAPNVSPKDRDTADHTADSSVVLGASSSDEQSSESATVEPNGWNDGEAP